MKRILITTAAIVALAACQSASMPTYQAAGGLNQVGYMSTEAENDQTTVFYTGSKGTTRAQVAEYALLRAAELTEEAGYEWFAVLGTSTEKVNLATETDLTDKGALDGGSASTGSGADASEGFGDSPGVSMGPNTGGFGGGAVPYQVTERWTPPQGFQTRLLIQMGNGDEASFPGATTQPDIFPAAETAAGIREKMAGE